VHFAELLKIAHERAEARPDDGHAVAAEAPAGTA
jgi:hypothetical protein